MPRQVSFREQLIGFPFAQIAVLAAVRFAEPIAYTSLFPYVFFMVKSLTGSEKESEVARYAGYISGGFALCQSFTGVFWGRLSDRIGRKPVIIMGLLGTATTLIVFGFSTSLPMAMIARGLGGALNGNVGVIRTSIGEIAVERKHHALAFSTVPLFWQIGCVIGPMVGGFFASPVTSHPSWFTDGSSLIALFSKYPFLLPNVIVTAALMFSMVVAIFFLEESHPNYKDRFDPGRWLLKKLTCSGIDRKLNSLSPSSFKQQEDEETRLLLPVEPPAQVDQSWSAVLNPRVRVILKVTGLMSLHTNVYEELMPIFLSSSITWSPGLSLRGGLEFTSNDMGKILSVTGILGTFMMLVVYPQVDRKYGTLRPFQLILRGHPVVYFLMPFLVLLNLVKSHELKVFLVTMVYLTRACFASMSFGPPLLLVTRAASHKTHLGTINGCSQMVSAFARASGPIVWGVLMSFGMRLDHVEIPWWSLTALALVNVKLADNIPEEVEEEEEGPTESDA